MRDRSVHLHQILIRASSIEPCLFGIEHPQILIVEIVRRIDARKPGDRRNGSVPQLKCYVDFRIHFHRLTHQQRGLVSPLLHGVQCRLNQQRVTADDLDIANTTVFPNDGMQFHDALTPT
jgi:hypothetical protein